MKMVCMVDYLFTSVFFIVAPPIQHGLADADVSAHFGFKCVEYYFQLPMAA